MKIILIYFSVMMNIYMMSEIKLAPIILLELCKMNLILFELLEVYVQII